MGLINMIQREAFNRMQLAQGGCLLRGMALIPAREDANALCLSPARTPWRSPVCHELEACRRVGRMYIAACECVRRFPCANGSVTRCMMLSGLSFVTDDKMCWVDCCALLLCARRPGRFLLVFSA